MAIQYKKEKDRIVIYIVGDFDGLQGENLFNFIKKVSDSYNNIVIDFSKIKYINSEGIEKIVYILNRLKSNRYYLEGLSKDIKEIFAGIGLI